MAGARPTSTAVAAAARVVYSSTRASKLNWCGRGTSPGISAPSAWTPHQASSRPRPAPSAASTRLSVSSWRAMRPRPAPSAARTASSRRRPVARTSSRLATFAQAMISTKATAPSSSSSAGRPRFTMSS